MRRNRFPVVLAVAAVTLLALATSAGAGLWTPAQISTDLWLDAADASTVTQSGGLVSQWDDKSGNIHHATATSMPTYSGSSMLFDYGTSRAYMTIPNHADLDIAGGKSIFTVYNYTTGGRTWSALLSKGSHSNQNGWALINRTTSTVEFFTNYRESIPQSSGGSQDLFYSMVTDGSISKSWQNGDNEQSVTKALVDNTTAEMVIGARNGNGGTGITDQFTGSIQEIVMVDGALSVAGRQQMEGYLAWKWGLEGNLPSGHPYEFAAPTVLVWDNGGSDNHFDTAGNWDTDQSPSSGTDSIVLGRDGTVGHAWLGTEFTIGSGQSMTVQNSPSNGLAMRIGNGGHLTVATGGSLDLLLGGQQGNIAESGNSNQTMTFEAGATARVFRHWNSTDWTHEFIADENGVTTFEIQSSFTLRGTGSVLDVDLSNYDLSNGDTLVLFDYGSLTLASQAPGDNGFGTMRLSGGWSADLDLYYDLGGGDLAIALTNIRVPEPSTFALATFGLLGLGFAGRRRRRRQT